MKKQLLIIALSIVPYSLYAMEDPYCSPQKAAYLKMLSELKTKNVPFILVQKDGNFFILTENDIEMNESNLENKAFLQSLIDMNTIK